jgi:hypothetical protein
MLDLLFLLSISRQEFDLDIIRTFLLHGDKLEHLRERWRAVLDFLWNIRNATRKS